MSKFTTLQAGRAIAAIMVVFFHAHIFFVSQRLYPGDSVSPIFNIGYSGVEFFFVLSGFIMILVHRKDLDVPVRAAAFLRKRITRIYPFYWVVMLALLTARTIVPGFGLSAEGKQASVLSSLMLIPSDKPFIITAAWTLSHEMLFYLIFAVLILHYRAGLVIFSAWVLGIVLFAIHGTAAFPVSFIFSSYNLLFPIGMLAAYHYSSVPIGRAWVFTVSGALCFLAVGILDVYAAWPFDEAARTTAYGVFAGLLVCGLARLETTGRIQAGSRLVLLGDASYSIYIVHGPALAALAFLARSAGLPAMIPPAVMLFLLVIVATAIGLVAHLLVERPLLAFFGRRFGRNNYNAPPKTPSLS